jgi:predicted phage tail protein
VKIVLHGLLKEQFEGCEIKADTVADAIEGWSRQCGLAEIPAALRPVIEIVDFDTAESLVEKTDVTEIHLVPAMFGGKGGFGQILIGAALIGLSFTGVGAALSAGLMAAGIGMAIGGVMSMFMKAPSVGASQDPEPSKYLGSNGNTTQIGTLIGKGYGRFKGGGQYLSIQVNSQDMVFGSFPASA